MANLNEFIAVMREEQAFADITTAQIATGRVVNRPDHKYIVRHGEQTAASTTGTDDVQTALFRMIIVHSVLFHHNIQ